MKKTFVLIAILIGSSISYAADKVVTEKPSIEFPLTAYYYINHRRVDLNLPQFNKELSKRGLEKLPEWVVVTKNPLPLNASLSKKIEASAAVVSDVIQKPIEFGLLNSPVQMGYFYEYPKMCYRGKVEEAAKILKAMIGNFLNDTQGILGIRTGNKIFEIWDQLSKPEIREGYIENGAEGELLAFEKLDKNSLNLVVLSDLGMQGDGTELYLREIAPCKKN